MDSLGYEMCVSLVHWPVVWNRNFNLRVKILSDTVCVVVCV